MPFVERDINGKIKGIYANLQPGYAEEFLLDSDPLVISFLSPKLIPDIFGFINDIKGLVGGDISLNILMTKYPGVFSALQRNDWTGLQNLIINANSSGIINSTQYSQIKTFVANRSIPITLS